MTLGAQCLLSIVGLATSPLNPVHQLLKVDTQHENQKRGQPNIRGPDNYKRAHIKSSLVYTFKARKKQLKTPHAYYKMSVHL